MLGVRGRGKASLELRLEGNKTKKSASLTTIALCELRAANEAKEASAGIGCLNVTSGQEGLKVVVV